MVGTGALSYKESEANRGCDVRSHVASDDVEGVG